MSSYPHPVSFNKQRHSDGWTTDDWQQLTVAMNLWTANESNEEMGWASDIFSDFNLWDSTHNEPMLAEARRLFMTRC